MSASRSWCLHQRLHFFARHAQTIDRPCRAEIVYSFQDIQRRFLYRTGSTAACRWQPNWRRNRRPACRARETSRHDCIGGSRVTPGPALACFRMPSYNQYGWPCRRIRNRARRSAPRSAPSGRAQARAHRSRPAAQARTKRKIKAAKNKKLYEAVVMRLAGSLLPRLNEHGGEGGGPIQLKWTS
jgi:hypothetical protein